MKKKKNENALFIVEVHLAIKLVHRHSTFNKLKEQLNKLNSLRIWLVVVQSGT